MGLTLACDLSYRGVKTILLEQSKTTSVIAKAFGLNSRTMEHFRRIGLEKKIQNASFPCDVPFNIGFYTALLNGYTSFKNTFDSWGDIVDGKLQRGYPMYEEGTSPSLTMFCPQSSSEPVLKEHLETTSDCVSVHYGHRVTAISQDDYGVVVSATTVDEQEEKIFKAKYAIACDGGSSPSRKLLGTHLYGKFIVARGVSIMFHSPQMYEQIKNECKAGMAFIVNSRFIGVSTTPNSEGDLVLHVTLPSNASDDEVRSYEENPEQTVKAGMGSDLPITVLASSRYNMHALISTKFRVGRVLFAGDSAHQWLPAGGLGLNTGIDDVSNLAWKLEAMVKGYGCGNLLDSYEEERRPMVDSTRRFVLSLGGNITLRKNPAFRIAQKIVLTAPIIRSITGWVLSHIIAFDSNWLTLAFQHSNSSIIVHERDEDGNIVRASSYREYRYPAMPGCRAPHVALPGSESILDLFGKTFVILVIGGEESDLTDLREEFGKRSIPLQLFCFPRFPDFAVYDRKYFLIRPDGIICWRSDSQPSALESQKIVATVIGDTSRSRLPTPEVESLRSSSQTGGFIFDLCLRFGVEMILSQFFHMSQLSSWLVSFTLFLTVRALRTRLPDPFIQETSRHSAVVLRRFGDASAVLEVDNRHTGSFGPHDVLIRVHAASVNPIDCQMRMGYGAGLLSTLLPSTRRSLFPLVLGRDCSGEVVVVGDAVTKFLPGDSVFAAVPVHKQGTHAQLVAVDEDCVSMKPVNADFKQAASLPWVACTAWCALVKNAGLNRSNSRGRKVLVHAGTGGIGPFAVQLLKAWGADVTVTCATQNVSLAHSLGADKVVDYTAGDFSSALSRYDVVLDSVGSGYEQKSLSVLKLFGGAQYISLASPQVWLAQKFGSLMGGLAFSWLYRFKVIFNRLFGGRAFYYSETIPDSKCLDTVSKMVEKGEIKSVIEAVYSMDEAVAAHKHLETGHSRGNIVISIP